MKAAFVNANPSVGIIYDLDRLELGSVNRISGSMQWPNGKAINAAIVFKKLGGDPIAVFPSGGELGKYLEEVLTQDSVRIRTSPISNEIRRTYTLFCETDGRLLETQMLEPGPTLTFQEQQAFLKLVLQICQNEDICVISGSLPMGVPETFYQELIRELRQRSRCRIILDTSGKALTLAVQSAPHTLKVNHREFQELTGITSNVSTQRLVSEMRRVGLQHAISYIFVTRGSASVFVWSSDNGAIEAKPPRVKVVNTVCAGDCFIAGWLSGIDDGLESGLRMAVATATAKVSTHIPRDIDLQLIRELYDKVEITRLEV